MPKGRTVLLPLLLVVFAAACIAPGEGGSSDGPRAERQRQIDGYATSLPWPVLDHARFVVESEPHPQIPLAVSDCPSRTVRVFPEAFKRSDEWLRWMVAHESGHQRDCNGLPSELYELIAQHGAATPHAPEWSVGEALADCIAASWIGRTSWADEMGTSRDRSWGYWNCPDEIVVRIPGFAPN